MKQYIWVTISTILIMNICKASNSANNTASELSTQDQEKIARLQQQLQRKYPEINIPELTIVSNNNYLSAQIHQQLQGTKKRSPFYEDILDNMQPLETDFQESRTRSIILPQSVLANSQEGLEKTILQETYFRQPSAIVVDGLCSAAIKTATAYSIIFGNILRTPTTVIIPNATMAKTFKCLAIPLIIAGKTLSYQKEQAQEFVEKHYRPKPMTATQLTIKDVHDEFKTLHPFTKQALEQTHLSTKKILELAQ